MLSSLVPTSLIPSSFRSRMALLFGCLSLLVGLPTYIYVSQVHREQLLKDRHEYLHALATSGATVIAENLVERRREIELLAQTPLYRNASLDSPEFRASLERLQHSYPYYSWIGLTDTDGQVRAATSDHLVGQSVAKRPWFKQGQAQVYVGDVHEALLLARLLPSEGTQPVRFIDFASPVRDAQGRVRAVLASHAHWRWAGDVLQVVHPAHADALGLEMFIVNQRNEVIYPTRTPSGLNMPPPERLSDRRNAAFLDWGAGQMFLSAASTIKDPVAATPLGWRVVVRQPEATVIASVRELQNVILVVASISSAALLLLVWVGAGRVSRPLQRLTRAAHRIERGENGVTFDARFGSNELRGLASAMQGMYATLKQQKDALSESNRDLEGKVAARTAELQRLNTELNQLARTDALTGVPNRLQSNERLSAEFARFRRSHQPYAVLMLDIDFFKQINDTHGHAIGDVVLQQVAAILRRSLRDIDFVGRTGGEEFMVILPMTRQDNALLVAEKLRHAVATHAFTQAGAAGQVTVSIGVQEASLADANPEQAVNHADHHLYQAKRAGRNRVEPGLTSQWASA